LHSTGRKPSEMDLYGSARRTQKPQVLDVARTQTTGGKAVVRAPILVSEEKRCEDDLELPPPSAAELKYTAQRALLTTTAALKASTSSGARPSTHSKGTRTGGEPKASMGQQSRQVGGLGDLGQFKIDLEFDSERPYARAVGGGVGSGATNGQQAVQKRQQGPAAAPAAVPVGRLEQGRLSTESVLESWGIATAVTGADLSMSNMLATSAVGPAHDTEEESDTDSVVEDTALRVEGMARGYPAAIDSVVRSFQSNL
ncbi:hypothetical protein FBU59_005248, partial [Linderina macrospora]